MKGPSNWYDTPSSILPREERIARQQKILWELSTGLPQAEIARRNGVSGAYVSKLKRNKVKKMGKIVSISRDFHNFKAFLAHVGEDESAVGFVGVIIKQNSKGERTLVEVNFGSSTAEAALCSLVIGRLAIEGETT